jgi:hypothetical protein
VRKILVLGLLLLPAFAAAQECVDAPAAPVVLSAEIRAARSFRAGEAPVPFEVQKATLDGLLREIGARARERREDPTLPKYVVMIDLDNTSFVPTARVHAGLEAVAEKYGIPELEDPSDLDLLPHYSRDGFLAWATESGLRAKYPSVNWVGAYYEYYDANWQPENDGTETLVPGLAEFSRRVSRSGGVVVFNTARKESQRAVTEETLRKNGIPNPKVTMKPNNWNRTSAAWKVKAVDEIRAKWGEPIALIDETAKNREAMTAAFPNVAGVAISIPGFTTEMSKEELDAEPLRISTYER